MRRLKYLYLKLRSYFPSQLPNGMTSLNAYLTNVILLAGKGIPDNRSTRFAVSTMIMHLGQDKNGYAKDAVPMNYFVRKLRKAAANEAAYAMLEQMKKEKEAIAATASSTVATTEQQSSKPTLTIA